MLVVIAVLIGCVSAVIGIKKGFFAVWPVFFNILIAIYIGIMLTPTIVGLAPEIEESGYYGACCVACIAILVFAVLQAVVTIFFSRMYEAASPEILDRIGSAVLGFLSGYLVCSFVVLLIFITPFARHPALKGRKDSTPTAVKSVANACSFVDVISLNCRKDVVDGIINWLIAIEDEPQEQD